MHIGWVPDQTDGYRRQMAVYVKPNGLLGNGYMAAIKPFRHLIVYPQLMRQIEQTWRARPSRHRRTPETRLIRDWSRITQFPSRFDLDSSPNCVVAQQTSALGDAEITPPVDSRRRSLRFDSHRRGIKTECDLRSRYLRASLVPRFQYALRSTEFLRLWARRLSYG